MMINAHLILFVLLKDCNFLLQFFNLCLLLLYCLDQYGYNFAVIDGIHIPICRRCSAIVFNSCCFWFSHYFGQTVSSS